MLVEATTLRLDAFLKSKLDSHMLDVHHATYAGIFVVSIARVQSFAFAGIDAQPVEVQVQISSGLPAFLMVGLPDKAVGEARERVRAALTAMGLALPPKRILVNLAPADMLKEGSHFDLPVALAVLAAMDVLPREELGMFAALGELSLDGRIMPVAGVLPAAMAAGVRELGLICPEPQGPEAGWAGELTVLAAPDLLSLINHFRGTQVLSPPPEGLLGGGYKTLDLADVRGMETARRALEIAAAGGHNLLMIGPPGGGKTMLAARLPGLLPDLQPREALEVSMVHSVAGLLEEGRLVTRPPFREPHHSASMAAISGGGNRAKPGEVSLAHRGVLFMDELPEFPRATLEAIAPAAGGRPNHGGAGSGPHHLSGTVSTGGRDEPLPLRLSRRCAARMRPGAALWRGIPDQDQRPVARPDRPDHRNFAGHAVGVIARPARRAECGGRPAGGGGARAAARTLRRRGCDDECRSASAGDRSIARGCRLCRDRNHEIAPFRQGIYPNPAGRPDHRRSGGAENRAAHPYRRSIILPAPHSGPLGGGQWRCPLSRAAVFITQLK